MLSLFHILHLRGVLIDGKDDIARYENTLVSKAPKVLIHKWTNAFDAPFETLFA